VNRRLRFWEKLMIIESGCNQRSLKQTRIDCDFAIIGGGLSGVCCAVTAAREGLKVVLLQDRPVLGGNASSEIRLWALGATSHLGNNNRWSREGGVINEIVVENLYRNSQGNPVIFDSVVLDKVLQEQNITLLLNTAVFSIEKFDNTSIKLVRGFCSQNATLYEISAPLFCDASGDGIVGYLAGAEYRMGAESSAEFSEKFAPVAEYGSLMGHSIFFYSKYTDKPVKFIPPSYALTDITRIPRYRDIALDDKGSQLWWLEYGGRLDTIHDSEKIKWELWRIVYGVWNYIKNSGNFPESETMTLEWVGMIPGKRESRRFIGDYILNQQDIVEQRQHYDAVSYGGWAIDLHPADGVYSDKPGCDQWHSKGIYQIPYRCMYSKNINNLFLAGRIISTSHVANGSTRVMMTCAHNAQAVGVAAALCCSKGLMPHILSTPKYINQLQQQLIKQGQFIPGISLNNKDDLAIGAKIIASSCLELSELEADGPIVPLENSIAMILPLKPGLIPSFSFEVCSKESTELTFELRVCSRRGSFTPDVVLASKTIKLLNNEYVEKQPISANTKQHEITGVNKRMAVNVVSSKEPQFKTIKVDFNNSIGDCQYVFICLMQNPAVFVRCSNARISGLLFVRLQGNHRVNNSFLQKPNYDIGIDTMEFWIPQRWPDGHNLAFKCEPSIDLFGIDNLTNGISRPVLGPNAWVAAMDDSNPVLTLKWDRIRTICRIELGFDTDWDHPMESVLMGHPYNVIPYCVRKYRILDSRGSVLYECSNNYQSRNIIVLNSPILTDELRIELVAPDKHIPVALFEIHCYGY